MARLTVSIPTHNTPYKLLRRSVQSALASKGVDLRVVVVRDGGAELRDLPDDPRLTVLNLPQNRGRYFADAVVTTALDDGYWCPLDSDDWIEPDHYAKMLELAEKNGAVVSRYWRHHPKRKEFIQEPAKAGLTADRPGFVHLFHWCSGVYSVDRVRLAGGVHPGYRVGYDTLFAMMVALTGPVDVSDSIGFHWCRRVGYSLTTAPDTRFGSPHRAQAKAQLRVLWDKAYKEKGKDPGAVIRADVPPELMKQVQKQADRLKEMLDA